MCIIFVAHHVHPRYPLIIASNRDEYLDRPTEPMRVWEPEDYFGGGESSSHISSSCEGTGSDNGDGNSSGGDGRNCNCDGNNNSVNGNSNSNDESEFSHRQDSTRNSRRRSSLAGKDLVRGGTWLGISLPEADSDSDLSSEKQCEGDGGAGDSKPASLRWIAITNFREKDHHGRPSRGGLLMEYLDGDAPSAPSFISGLRGRGNTYNGFNLLVGDRSGIYYYGNRMKDDQSSTESLNWGIHGLSNGLLDTPWPKVERGKELLNKLCREECRGSPSPLESLHERLMEILSDQVQPPCDDQLPRTGLDLESERYLSSIFVPKGELLGKAYGTRSSTTIVVDLEGRVSVLERTWHSGEGDRWFCFDSKGVNKLEGMLISQTQ